MVDALEPLSPRNIRHHSPVLDQLDARLVHRRERGMLFQFLATRGFPKHSFRTERRIDLPKSTRSAQPSRIKSHQLGVRGSRTSRDFWMSGSGQGRGRTADFPIFSPALGDELGRWGRMKWAHPSWIAAPVASCGSVSFPAC
jgi:hypothetical protein